MLLEVRTESYCYLKRFLCSRTEQRKAALRRVEMELDEADEMVRYFYNYPPFFHQCV